MKTSRLVLIVLVLTILVALVPLAHTSPPYPTWMPGLWDNADYDDVVLLVTSEIGFVEAAVDREINCLLIVFGRVRSFTSGILSVWPFLPDCPRAPPTASALP